MAHRTSVFLLLAALLFVAFAGCLAAPGTPGEDEAAPQRGDTDLFGADSPVASPPRVPVPQWQVGESWRYRVEGDWIERPYHVAVGVVGTDAGQYRLGVDRMEEVALHVAHGGPFGGAVDAGTLAIHGAAGIQDLIGFGRTSAWTAVYQGRSLTMQTDAVRDVAGPDGLEPGQRTRGTDDAGHVLEVAYGARSAWLTSLVWQEDDRVLVRYTLEAVGMRDPAGLFTWSPGAARQTSATGLSLVRTVEWTSDGSADLVVVRGAADTARAGRGTIWDPDVRPVLAVSSRMDGPVGAFAALNDEPGTWRAVATSLGGRIELGIQPVRVHPGGVVDEDPGRAPMTDDGVIERVPVVGDAVGDLEATTDALPLVDDTVDETTDTVTTDTLPLVDDTVDNVVDVVGGLL